MNSFKERVGKQAAHLLQTVFPAKVRELNNMLESEKYKQDAEAFCTDLNIARPSPITAPPTERDNSTQKTTTTPQEATSLKRPLESDPDYESDSPQHSNAYKIPVELPKDGQLVPCNVKLMEMVEEVQPYIQELMDHASTAKLWIQFLTPKMEDGNNFGVEVQEEAWVQLREVEFSAMGYTRDLGRYPLARAEVIAKVMKNPYVEDYRQAVVECEKNQYMQLKRTVTEIRNDYSNLLDIITKNREKIVKPKGAHAEAEHQMSML